MRITNLQHEYRHAPRLAALHASEWQHLYEEWSAPHALAEFAVQHSDGRVPATLIALDGDTLLGSVSLILDDLPGWEHLNPWLASFYVLPAYRRAGIGARLLEAAEAVLRAQRVAAAYLFTETRAAYFATHGWRAFAPIAVAGQHATVMVRKFDHNQSR
jgi:GNAT superfamily N-acetyltransferase